ncbi:MAG: hypothetical protein R6V32_10390, partial [Bacteroidales bacterium]
IKLFIMKKIKSILLGIVIVAFLASCGGGSGSVKPNKYLKDLPPMAAEILDPANKIKDEIDELDEEMMKDETSRKKALKIMEDIDKLEKELESKEEEMEPKIKEMNEYVKNELAGKDIPFEVASEVDNCTLESIKIDKMEGKRLDIKAIVKPTDDFPEYRYRLEVSFKLLDEEGNKILYKSDYIHEDDYSKGETSQLLFSVYLDELAQLSEFAKVIVTKGVFR